MEKIKQRKMSTFILSSLINVGIGFVFGFVLAIIAIINSNGQYSEIFRSFDVFNTSGYGYISGFWSAILRHCLPWTIVVSLLAGNMYRMYFYYRLSLDINAVCEGDGEESESYVTALVLSFITFGAYRVYWTCKLAKRLRANAPRYGFKMLETGKDIALLNTLSFGFIGAWELIKYMNRISKVYNEKGLPEVVGGVQ